MARIRQLTSPAENKNAPRRAGAGRVRKVMLTDFEVRRRMGTIQAARLAPLRKARLLLRLGKSLQVQAESLGQAKRQIARGADPTAVAGLTRMANNVASLREDLRDAALYALAHGDDQD